MRYILDDLGYIEAVSCTYIECSNKSCTEYIGAIPEGYETLDDWVLNANIRAYKIVDNNLVYDANRAAALEEEWAEIPDGDFSDKVTFEETYSNIHFYKKNGIVCIVYQGEAKTHSANAKLFTIPEGYRPPAKLYFPFVKNNNAYGVIYAKDETGEFFVNQISSTSANGRVYFTVSYNCEE